MSGVTLPGVSIPFTEKNFSPLMSTLVEARYKEETSAKDILAVFVEAFARRISETQSYDEILTLLERYIREGEILFASRDDRIEAFLDRYKKPLPWKS